MATTLKIELRNGIGYLTLDRPKQLNALNDTMAFELRELLNSLGQDDGLRCLVIQGAGDHFMAGGDIAYFKQATQQPLEQRREQVKKLVDVVHDSIQVLRRMDKPVIASVQGSVAGFGMSLMMACDLAVAADTASFVQAYTQIGTTPDGGNTFHLPRMIGMKRAMGLTLLNTPVDAQQALAMGLVNQVVPVDRLSQEVEGMARQLAAGAPQAIALAKQLINQSYQSTLQQQLDAERERFTDSFLSNDFSEGVSAFVEKRRPDFNGD